MQFVRGSVCAFMADDLENLALDEGRFMLRLGETPEAIVDMLAVKLGAAHVLRWISA